MCLEPIMSTGILIPNGMLTPENELERLEALHALPMLDTPAEPRFDRFTRLAATLFNAPTARVSLIDADRQWFKSRPASTPARRLAETLSAIGRS